MGYVYTSAGLLCCDYCGAAGGVRRKRCPFDWCPPAATCSKCRTDPEVKAAQSKAAHTGCETAANEFAEQKRAEQFILDSGEFLRCSAINDGLGVKVTFRNEKGEHIERHVTKESYDAISLMTPTTPDDYEVIT